MLVMREDELSLLARATSRDKRHIYSRVVGQFAYTYHCQLTACEYHCGSLIALVQRRRRWVLLLACLWRREERVCQEVVLNRGRLSRWSNSKGNNAIRLNGTFLKIYPCHTTLKNPCSILPLLHSLTNRLETINTLLLTPSRNSLGN